MNSLEDAHEIDAAAFLVITLALGLAFWIIVKVAKVGEDS